MNATLHQRPILASLPLQIADQLSTRIVEGQFQPGERLLETELAQSYAVSRATIREALRMLEQRGLVTILAQRGARVTELSAEELDDLFEVRASLLATGVRLAAERRTPETEKRLQEHLALMKKVVKDGEAYTNASAAMVDILMQQSGNDVLVGYVRDFALRIGRYARLGLSSPTRRQASLAAWQQVVSAIIKGDGIRASDIQRDLALANQAAAMVEFTKGAPLKPR